MSQPRIYIDNDNHEWFTDKFVKQLRENETVKRLGMKIDQNQAFAILKLAANIDVTDPDSIETAIQVFLRDSA